MSISPTLGGKLLSIPGQFPCIAWGWGSGGGAIDRCIRHMPISLTYKLLPSNNPNHRQQFFLRVYMEILQVYMSFLQVYMGNRYLFLTNQITGFLTTRI